VGDEGITSVVNELDFFLNYQFYSKQVVVVARQAMTPRIAFPLYLPDATLTVESGHDTDLRVASPHDASVPAPPSTLAPPARKRPETKSSDLRWF
jgi:hypothetical protein